MLLRSRISSFAGIGIVLLALCLAGATQAATRMYNGTLIIHSFGNDSTGGTGPYETSLAVGIPLTGRCNTEPLHLQETLVIPLPASPTDDCSFPPCYTVSFTIPTYGGQIAVIDTNGDTLPDQATGCGPTTVQGGAYLAGAGPVDTTGATNTARTANDPRAISLPEWALRRSKSGETAASFEAYGVYLWEVHFANLHNDNVVLAKDGGDGDIGPIVFNAAKEKRSLVQKAGKNKFGGVMQILGNYGDNEGYFYNNATTSVFYFNWLFNYIGIGGQATSGNPLSPGDVTGGYKKTYVAYGYTRSSGYQTTSTVYASLFKWTTGTVTVTAKGGSFPTVLQRKGYDKRTPMGSGAVQLVSPMLTKWVGAGTSATAAIGIMKLSFAPEPSEWMMLASSISLLGLLAHWRRSRRP